MAVTRVVQQRCVSIVREMYTSTAAKPLLIRVMYAVAVVCSLVVSSQLVLAAHGRQVRTSRHIAEEQIDESTIEVPQDLLRGPGRPAAPRPGVSGCQSRDIADIAGMPPCQDEAPEPGQENATAKVALMFLIKDQIPTEPLWTAFIASAAELTLRKAVPPTRPQPPTLFPKIAPIKEEMKTTCWRHGGVAVPLVVPPRERFTGAVPPKISNVTAWLQQGCSAGLTGSQLYAMQNLFSIYVHRSPGKPGSPKDSIFYNRDIPKRVQGVFAQPSLVLAHRLLLAEALKDTANSMFVLVSESCTPLYHPALFWAQLMAESHVSRMSDGMFGVHRWSPKMATDLFKPGHFRKGSQFSSLTRMHAQYVAYDEHVWTQFHAYCKTQIACNKNSPHHGHICVADEHYVASLLSAYKMRDTFDRIGMFTFVDWKSVGGWHPKTFYPGDSLQSLYAMRSRSGPPGCDVMPLRALQTAATLFKHSDTCHAVGDRIVPIEGAHYQPFPSADRSRRSLLTASGDVNGGNLDRPGPEWLESHAVAPDGPYGSAGRRKLNWVAPEFGPERERLLFNRASTIRQVQAVNLRKSGWLGGFEPMLPTCPLTARKVSAEAVSELASIAWRCDGLGFAFECLQPQPLPSGADLFVEAPAPAMPL